MTRLAREPVMVGGPWFEDFARGQLFDDAPGVTVTSGHAAVHQALVGDRLRLALDDALCRAVTGRETSLVHPNLVCDVAIGQSTGPSQRVRGNLFYRGLVLARPVFVGETLRTRTEIVGLKQNRRRDGAQASGLVAMRVRTTDEHGEPVLDFWRCPMIPLRDPEADTGHADDFTEIPQELDQARLAHATPVSSFRCLALIGGVGRRPERSSRWRPRSRRLSR
jgi:acyl dehydratase